MDIETKINIEEEVKKARKELKDTLADLDIAKKEKVALDSILERNKKIIDEQNEELKGIINDIAGQKLEWLHEKDEQVKALEEKEKGIDEIYARSADLDVQEAEINRLHEEVKAVRNENSQILLDVKAINVSTDEKVKYAERKMIEVTQKEHEIDVKILNFKEQVEKVIKELIKI